MSSRGFSQRVLTYYAEHGRHTLPWRKTKNPYAILVSELMLQQTQVDRVIPYFKAWMKQYPDVETLAAAPLADVLISWQGLGYNRRAKMLQMAAKCVVEGYGGKVPRTVEELERLPGVGPYTARAIAAFAYNQPVVFVETNLRTAVVHHFFTDCTGIPDAEVTTILDTELKKVLKKGVTPREWYSALMDYGAHLKRSGVKVNARSKGYAKQAAFKGSGREVRGAILRALVTNTQTSKQLLKLFPDRAPEVKRQIAKLVKEELIQQSEDGRTFRLPR